MRYTDIVDTVAKEVNLPSNVVKEAYKAYWEFIRTTIKNLPLKEDISDEELLKLKTNFNIPSLGKLTATYDKILKYKRKYKR